MTKNEAIEVEDYNVKVYQQVLNGELKKFPRYFWKEEYKSAPAIIRYLIENVLGWNEEDVKNKFNTSTLENNKLSGLLKYVNNENLFAILDEAYPGKYLPWELSQVPSKYWRNEENCIKVTRWAVFEVKKWNRDDIVKKFNKNLFYECKLTGLLKWGWNGNTLDALLKSFPEYNFQKVEIEGIPIKESEIELDDIIAKIKAYIEEQGWDREEIKKEWRARNLQKTDLMKFVKKNFDNNMFKAIDTVFPEEFKRWEFPVDNGYWTKETAKEAMHWLAFDVLKITDSEDIKKITKNDIRDYKLTLMLKKVYNNDLKKALEELF